MNPYEDIFLELEQGLLEHSDRVSEGIAQPYEYSDEVFRACLHIFLEALIYKIYVFSEGNSISSVAKAVEKLRDLVFQSTGINSFNLYKE